MLHASQDGAQDRSAAAPTVPASAALARRASPARVGRLRSDRLRPWRHHARASRLGAVAQHHPARHRGASRTRRRDRCRRGGAAARGLRTARAPSRWRATEEDRSGSEPAHRSGGSARGRARAAIRSRHCAGRSRARACWPASSSRGATGSARTASGGLLKRLGYSLQGNKKTIEGNQHPDRDEQVSLHRATDQAQAAWGRGACIVGRHQEEGARRALQERRP